MLSQDSSKVWIERKNALKVLAAADSGRAYMAKSIQLKKDVDSLTEAIGLLEAVIDELAQQDSILLEVIRTYEDEITVMKGQRKIFEGQIKYNEKSIRKLKRKVFWTSVFGLAAAGTLTYLYVTK